MHAIPKLSTSFHLNVTFSNTAPSSAGSVSALLMSPHLGFTSTQSSLVLYGLIAVLAPGSAVLFSVTPHMYTLNTSPTVWLFVLPTGSPALRSSPLTSYSSV